MERLLSELVHALPPLGFEVHVVMLEDFGRFAEGLDEVARLHRVPPMTKLSLLYPLQLKRVIQAIQPDVVHSHAGVWLKAGRSARLAGVPAVIHTEHGRPNEAGILERRVVRSASRTSDAIIAVSEALADLLRGMVWDPARVQVITNGVDLGRLGVASPRESVRAALEIPPEGLIIGSVGRLEPVKDYELALSAFAQLEPRIGPGQVPPFLVFIGDGSQRAALEHRAKALGVASRVRFLGWRNDVEQLYSAFDLFTLTSRSEGTSVSLLEAMGSGLCPIVTDVGGNRAVLGPELEASLVPSGDAEALAAAWRRWLTSHAARVRAGELARERVRTGFSMAGMVERHVELYRLLLARSDWASRQSDDLPEKGPIR